MKYFIVNYKTYPQASGAAALELTKKLFSVELPKDVRLVICPQAADIYRIREHFPDIDIWAQHFDLITAGQATGWSSLETLVMAGINGTLLNHSEHQISYDELVASIQVAKEHDLFTCVAVESSMIAEKIADTKPDMLAFEVPELIGSGKSLMQVDPGAAEEFRRALSTSDIALTIGAGVSTHADFAKAIELEYAGVLLASAITKAEDPAERLKEIIGGK